MFRIRKVISSIIRHYGYQLQPIPKAGSQNIKVPGWKHQRVLEEYTSFLLKSLSLNIPVREGRVKLLGELEGVCIAQALFLIKMMHDSLPVSGDICEFGVAAGATSALLANELKSSDKTYWLFDSFEGLSKPTAEDVLTNDVLGLGAMDAYEGAMSFPMESVQTKLASVQFPSHRIRIIPGFVEHSLKGNHLPERVCFAFIDMDLYEPILTALDFLVMRTEPGANIIVDDYDYFSRGAKTAVDEFYHRNQHLFTLTRFPDYYGHFVQLTRISD